MSAVEKEWRELEVRTKETEEQPHRKTLTARQANSIRKMMEKINQGLESLDFIGRQKLLRLLVEKVAFDGENVEIQTIILWMNNCVQ